MPSSVESSVYAGKDTRLDLIRAAVRHFARDGYAAASLRAIQREAGANAAAAHYHFGSKAALYRAVIENFIHGIQQERLRRHAKLPKALGGKARLERLLYDYFWPGVAIAADPDGYHYSLILARVQGELPSEASRIFLEAARPVRLVYLDSLRKLFPDVREEDLVASLTAGVTLMATTPLRFPPGSESRQTYADRHAKRLAKFLAAGMIALHGEPQNGV